MTLGTTARLAVFVSALVASQSSIAGQPFPVNWFSVTIDGWQTQCNVQGFKEDKPSKCTAIYPLQDGVATLTFTDGTLDIAVFGGCGGAGGKSHLFHRPIIAIEEALRNVARLATIECHSTVLPSQTFSDMTGLNVLLTSLTKRSS